MRRTVLHLGFPKAGTTSLQAHLFDAAASSATVTVLGIPPEGPSGAPNTFLRFRRHLLGLRPARLPPAVRWPGPAVLEAGAVEVLTDEVFLDLALRRAIADADDSTEPLDAALSRLRNLLPHGSQRSLLLTTRAQHELVPSLVAQVLHLLPRSRRDLDGVVDLLEHEESLLARLLDFEWTLTRIRDALDVDAVHLLPLELLRIDPNGYWRRLHSAVGLPPPIGEDRASPPLNERRVDGRTWRSSAGGPTALAMRAFATLPLPLPPESVKRRIRLPGAPTATGRSPVLRISTEQVDRIRRRYSEGYAGLLRSAGLGEALPAVLEAAAPPTLPRDDE